MDQTEKSPLNAKNVKTSGTAADPYKDLPVDKGWAWVILTGRVLLDWSICFLTRSDCYLQPIHIFIQQSAPTQYEQYQYNPTK